MANAERLDIVPARFQIIVTIRPKYAYRSCDAGISQAETPHWLIEGGLPTEGTLAHVAPLGDASIACRATGVQIRRSLAALSPVPDLWAGWRQPGPLNPCNMGSGITAYHLAPVVDRMLVHLKRSTRLFMPSRQIAAQSPAG
jgi:transposase